MKNCLVHPFNQMEIASLFTCRLICLNVLVYLFKCSIFHNIVNKPDNISYFLLQIPFTINRWNLYIFTQHSSKPSLHFHGWIATIPSTIAKVLWELYGGHFLIDILFFFSTQRLLVGVMSFFSVDEGCVWYPSALRITFPPFHIFWFYSLS